MPELHYLDNQNDALNSTARALGGLSAQIPYLRIQAERIRQQRALDDARSILYGAQANRAVAQTKLADAQRLDYENKTQQSKDLVARQLAAAEARRRIHEAQMNPATLGPITPSPMGMVNALAPIAAQQQGMQKDIGTYMYGTTAGAGEHPERAEAAIRGTLADIVSGLANNPGLAQAVVTRSQLMHNIPANNVSQNLATGQMTPGAVNVPAAGTVQMPGQAPVLGQQRTGQQMPPELSRYRAQLEAAHRATSGTGYTNMINRINAIPLPMLPSGQATSPGAAQQSLGGTNAVPSPSAQLPAQAKGKPTRAQAADYVKQFGPNAKDALTRDGFDISGYAD